MHRKSLGCTHSILAWFAWELVEILLVSAPRLTSIQFPWSCAVLRCRLLLSIGRRYGMKTEEEEEGRRMTEEEGEREGGRERRGKEKGEEKGGKRRKREEGRKGKGKRKKQSNKNRRLPAGFSLLLTSHFSSLLHSAPTIFQSHQRAAPDITACVGLCSVGKKVECPWSCNLPTRRLSSVHF